MAKDFMVKESELDDVQIKFLSATLDKSLIVTGCAGSGKSVLALHMAKRIQSERGNNYAIIVLTKALNSYMEAGRSQLGLTQPFFYHWDWKNRQGMPQGYDYLIVDEIQDFSREEVEIFIKSAKHCLFFGDSEQSIYGSIIRDKKGETPISVDEIVVMLPDRRRRTENLHFNYRLPKPVAIITEQFVRFDHEYVEGNYKSAETKKPYIIKYKSLDAQLEAIARIVTKGNLTDVGILAHTNKDVAEMSKLLNKHGLDHEYKIGNDISLDFDTTNPKLMTFHSAKGLQFETVFIPNLQAPRDEEGQRALYVAMTRTYRSLYVMYSGQLPAPLSNVPAELYLSTEIEKVGDI